MSNDPEKMVHFLESIPSIRKERIYLQTQTLGIKI